MLIKSLVDTSLLQDSGWVGAKLTSAVKILMMMMLLMGLMLAMILLMTMMTMMALSGDGDQDVVETDIVNVVPLFRDMCHGANEPPN